MHILALGLNHRTAPVAVRERLALDGGRLAEALAAMRAETREAVVLATCNRTELYAVTAHVESGFRALRRVVASLGAAGGGEPETLALEPFLHEWADADAVRHLLRVAAGLDSLIVGEPQIMGQVRDAFAAAQGAGTTGPILARLLRTALEAGKEARTVTGIARGAASISHAAVELARAEIPDCGPGAPWGAIADSRNRSGSLRGRAVLVIGAGEMAALAAGALVGHGARVTVVNRTEERAVELATRLGGRARPFEELPAALGECDIALTSTGAMEPIVTPGLLGPVLPQRAGRPLLLLDIAVPRDVDPAVGALPGVTLRNIDDLRETVGAGLTARGDEVGKVEALLDRHAADFHDWYRAREVVPTIAALRAKAEAIREGELAKALGRLGHLDDRDRNAVAALSVAIANKLIHGPMTRLKDPADGGDYVAAANELFDLPRPRPRGEHAPVERETVTRGVGAADGVATPAYEPL